MISKVSRETDLITPFPSTARPFDYHLGNFFRIVQRHQFDSHTERLLRMTNKVKITKLLYLLMDLLMLSQQRTGKMPRWRLSSPD
jgi:hypothetical protein